MSTAVTFKKHALGYAVRFTYSPLLVELIKTTVPSYARSWCPATKQWTVETVYARPLADAFRRLGYAVIGLEPPRQRKPADDDDPSHWARLLFKRVGRSRSEQVYRALSRCLHPDVGGDTELQKELNLAHAELTTNTRGAA